jgi:hypothetical protein
MTDVFKRYDDDRDGFIQLSFEEFLTEILRQRWSCEYDIPTSLALTIFGARLYRFCKGFVMLVLFMRIENMILIYHDRESIDSKAGSDNNKVNEARRVVWQREGQWQ